MWFKIFKQANNEIMSSFKETVKTNILPIVLTVLGLMIVAAFIVGGFYLISIVADMIFAEPRFAILVFVLFAVIYAVAVISYAAALVDKMRTLYFKFKQDNKEVYRRLSE